MLYLGAKKSLLSSGKTLAQQVAALFAGGEQGAWYEPSLTNGTLFQDSAGTTPVTDVGQPVGLMLDKSGRGSRATQSTTIKRPVLSARVTTLIGTKRIGDTSQGWNIVGTGPAVTYSVADPDGLPTASRLAFSVAGQGNRLVQNSVSIAGVPSLSSVYLRGTAGGESIGFWDGFTIRVLTLTTSWVRYSTAPGTEASKNILLFANSGTPTIEAAWPQAELGTVASRYQWSDTSTNYDAVGFPLKSQYDGIDDVLVTTFTVSLGGSCTICRAVPGVGASILTSQTIGTSYSDSTSHAGLIIINRALTAAETASVTAYLNAKAGGA